MRSSASRSASLASGASCGSTTSPCDAPIRTVAALAERVDRAGDERVVVVERAGRRAGRTRRRRGGTRAPTAASARREAPQQRVAGRVAERVVVVLEAVEVEEDQRVRAARRAALVEVVEQRAPVRQLGQLVGQRLVAGGVAAAGSSRRSISTERAMPANSAAAASTSGERAVSRARRAGAWRSPSVDAAERHGRRSPSRRAGASAGAVRCQAASAIAAIAAATGCRASCRRRRCRWTPEDADASPSAQTARPPPSSHQAAPGPPGRRGEGDEHDDEHQQVADEVGERDRDHDAAALASRRGRVSKTVPAASAARVRPARMPSIVSHAGNGRTRSRSSSAERRRRARRTCRGRGRRRCSGTARLELLEPERPAQVAGDPERERRARPAPTPTRLRRTAIARAAISATAPISIARYSADVDRRGRPTTPRPSTACTASTDEQAEKATRRTIPQSFGRSEEVCSGWSFRSDSVRSMPTGAQIIVSELERAGVSVCFGLPGVHNLALWAALRESSIRLSASATSRPPPTPPTATPAPRAGLGVALTTTGPGAANTLGAVGEAWASRSPILVIATDIPSGLRRPGEYRGILHETDGQSAMFAPVVKSVAPRPDAPSRRARRPRRRSATPRHRAHAPGLPGDRDRPARRRGPRGGRLRARRCMEPTPDLATVDGADRPR